MDQETAINVKYLRAKFQESQAKERPPIPERPKRLAVPAACCGPQPICPKTMVRNDHKRLVPVPVNCLQTTAAPAIVCTSVPIAKATFKDRHLPLVLPIPFSSEPKLHSVSPPRGVSSPVRGKKKPMMPFKSTITAKFGRGNLENGEHTFSVEKSKAENGFGYNGDSSNPGSVNPSPEKPGTPPLVDAIEGSCTEGSASQTSHQRVLSTLEKAKRKFSPKQLLEYAKPRSFHSRSLSPSASPPPPPVDYENLIPEHHPPMPQPESILPPVPLHAPPSPFQSNGISFKYATVNRDKGYILDQPAVVPPVKVLPDLQSLGSRPVKPPRPPLVDLSPFSTTNVLQSLLTASASATSEDVNLDQHVLEAPEVPDFDPPEPVHMDYSAFDLAHANMTPVVPETLGEVGFPPTDPVDLGYMGSSEPLTTEQVAAEAPEPPALPPWVDTQPPPVLETDGAEEISDCALSSTQATDSLGTSELASEQNVSSVDSCYEHCDNIYEDVASVAKFFSRNQDSRKRKEAPKSKMLYPYASPPLNELTRKTVRSIAPWSKEAGDRITLTRRHSTSRKERGSPETQEQKEQKKKEKQHQEKEKKEQKERQKRENEMKKKFKVTGLEEPMYYAKVMVTSKVRKHDLPVKSGDEVSIIRTNNCPKGKWLARDATHIYGYVSLKNLELNIKEMLELGKRVATGFANNEGDTISLGSRSSTQNPTHTSSFTDDSEEWTFEEETLSPATDMSQCRSMSMPEMYGSDGNMHHTQIDGTMNNVTAQTRHDALQKLAIFFQQSKGSFDGATDNGEATPTNTENTDFLCAMEEPPYLGQQEEDFEFAGVVLLPPPELYADT
ncbi:pollen-specific leucine-rich repeat extensin-like protein 1 isoform X1 [Alosa sapidissima]|uniref:pollen-specific leucine-rich repeat extensin-like protein 1 isoform X1 n=1 Tax=Alosa sapidissima TaxID=34773 RepID=UPI001C0825D5|nr:pollen-specific leucine-rich repeat extensin-like protein 1 isoform X1 [Alosa sapidissima]